MPFALAIDLGTSSIRASLWDDRGCPVGEMVRNPTSAASTDGGNGQFDAERLLEILESTLDEALARAGASACQIVAVGTSCFWHSLLGVNEAGEAVTSVSTWANTNAHETAARMRASNDESAYHRRTGAMLHSSYPIVRIAWSIEQAGSSSGPVAKWMSFADFVRFRLFGECATGASMASGTGLFDSNANDWDAESLAMAGVERSQLPILSELPASGLAGPYATRWPAIAMVPWFPAVGDGACATIGSGCVGSGRMALTLGTSGALRVVIEAGRVEIPDGLFAYRIDGRRWVVGGALSEGGGVVKWLCSMLGLTLGAELDAEIDSIPPDSHGLTLLPFAAGERSPGWKDDARCTISGLALDTRPVAIARAALESVAFRFQLIADRLREFAPVSAEIVGSGEALGASPAWCRILADTLGCRLVLPGLAESTSRGAALLALEATGDIGRLDEVPALASRTFEPDAAVLDVYRAAADRQQKLYDAIIS